MNRTVKRILMVSPFVIVCVGWEVVVYYGHPAALVIPAMVGFIAWTTWAGIAFINREW